MSRSEFRQVSYGSILDRYEIDLNTRIRTEIDLNESEIDLNECEHFLKAYLDRISDILDMGDKIASYTSGWLYIS